MTFLTACLCVIFAAIGGYGGDGRVADGVRTGLIAVAGIALGEVLARLITAWVLT